MSTETDKPSLATHGSDVNSTLVILKTLADTTWRMFIPPALGAVVGLQLESQGVHQAAVWGAIVGVVISGLLVWQQYRSVNRGKNT